MKVVVSSALAARTALTAAVLVVLVFAGCTGAGSPSGLPTFATATPPPASSPPAPSQAATPTGQATPAASLSPTAGALVINVTLTDALRMEPAQMTVPAGRPVTFVVTNQGGLEHEFYLGDAAAQAAHEAEMEASGGTMTHDDEDGIGVPPGATKELTFIFPVAGEWLAGCHVTNHYSGGMRATITVTD